MQRIFPIQGVIQPYQWGGFFYLSELLHRDNRSDAPQAEYWLGTHPSAPSTVLADQSSLSELLKNEGWNLQFLLKILDVREMLSIQVHPSREQAVKGFRKEQQDGIPLTAKHRNYKDQNHKPELMVALSEFWLLHGFREINEIHELLTQKPFLHSFRDLLQTRGLRAAFSTLLDASHPATSAAQQQLIDHLGSDAKFNDKTHPDFWVRRWLQDNPDVPNGILSLYFLNLVKLNPGEAIFQPAGLLHAYLEGKNVELMANSDNVLRAGLTSKHVDIPELLEIGLISTTRPVDYEATLTENSHGELFYGTPFHEFELSGMQQTTRRTFVWQSRTEEILFCVEGTAQITETGSSPINVQRGDAFFVAPGANLTLAFKGRGGRCFRARNLNP